MRSARGRTSASSAHTRRNKLAAGGRYVAPAGIANWGSRNKKHAVACRERDELVRGARLIDRTVATSVMGGHSCVSGHFGDVIEVSGAEGLQALLVVGGDRLPVQAARILAQGFGNVRRQSLRIIN